MTKKDIITLHPIHPWHERYIALTEDLPLPEVLENHGELFSGDERNKLKQLGDQTYQPGKWSAKDILQHLIDTERILSYRALCIARNSQLPLPGFEEAEYALFTNATERSIEDLLGELALLRRCTISLFKSFNSPMLCGPAYAVTFRSPYWRWVLSLRGMRSIIKKSSGSATSRYLPLDDCRYERAILKCN